MKVSPSILSCDFSKIAEELNTINEAEYVHIDVMDGMFVPNLTFGAPVIKCIRKSSNKVFDVHLMIEEPIRYIEEFVNAGSDIITVHAEACKDVLGTINKIKSYNVKAGIAIKPNTSVEDIESYLELVDMVLVMSVEPGFGGQSFMSNSLDKIKRLSDFKKLNNFSYEINVDGGINDVTFKQVSEAGVDVVVAGSYIFKSDKRNEVIKSLKK